MTNQSPSLAIEIDQPFSLEGLLCAANAVFPFLSEVHPFDHTINAVVAHIWVYLLYERMKFGRFERLLCKKVNNCLSKNPLARIGSRTELQYSFFGILDFGFE